MLVFPDYTQDNDLWIKLQDYQNEDWEALVLLWKCYNLHIAHIISSLDQTKLTAYWLDYEGHQVTLNDMVLGYADHLELHMRQIHELAEQDDCYRALDFWETRNSPERRVWDKYECCRGRSQFIFGTNSLLAKFFPAVIA